MEGFTYNGVHCEEMGLTYIPSAKEMFFTAPSYKPISQAVTAHPGAYWYGNDIEAREFSLPCYYEDLTWEQLEEIFNWVYRETRAQLWFDDRPDVYYIVRPSKEPTGERYVGHYSCSSPDELVYSGRITLNFTAYDPFGYLRLTTAVDGSQAMKGTGLIYDYMMPQNDTSLGNKLIWNPGTEKTPLRIEIAGTAPNGLTIHNYTTGETCRLTSLPEGETLVIDGATGMVALKSTATPAFEYHNDGYIHLDPYMPMHRDVRVYWTSHSQAIELQDGETFKSRDIGSYVRVGGYWRKIAAVAGTSATLTQPITEWGPSKPDEPYEEEGEEFTRVTNVQPTDNPQANGWYELEDGAESWEIPYPSTDTTPAANKTYYIRTVIPIHAIDKTVIGKMNEIYIEGEGATLTTLSFVYTPRVR